MAIYMDHHATTAVAPEVLAAMLPYFTEHFGNAQSRNHAYGWRAEAAVEVARRQVAALIGGSAREITFTSGATESNNLAFSWLRALGPEAHVITQATEHQAVLDPLRALTSTGCAVTVLPVDREGFVAPEALAAALRPETQLVSIMAANNEVGTVQDLGALGKVCQEAGVLFHTDATQATAWMALNVEDLGIHLLSLSGHKMYGPKGTGALYCRRREPRPPLTPMTLGGGHERGLRSGTLNVPGIVGLGMAAELAGQRRATDAAHTAELRDRLWRGLREGLGDRLVLHGPAAFGHRHPGNLSVSIRGTEAEKVILRMRDVAISSGAACASATLEPSHVMRALGVTPELALASLRFGIGRTNTIAEVDAVTARILEVVAEKGRQNRSSGAPR